MTTTAKQLVLILKAFLDFTWFANFLLIILAGGMLITEFMSNQYIETGYDLIVERQELIKNVKTDIALAKNIYITTQDAHITFEMKNTLFAKATSVLLFLLMELLGVSILFYLRKLFGNLKQNLHFESNNVIWLKKVALFVALIYPLQVLTYLLAQLTVDKYLIGSYRVRWEADFYILIIAAILYIVAEIFSRGLELRKENEEFV